MRGNLLHAYYWWLLTSERLLWVCVSLRQKVPLAKKVSVVWEFYNKIQWKFDEISRDSLCVALSVIVESVRIISIFYDNFCYLSDSISLCEYSKN